MKSQAPDLSWVNGRACGTVPVTDRGLQYGDGLFETLLYCRSGPVLMDRHFERLLRDGERLRLKVEETLLRKEFSAFLQQLEQTSAPDGIIKIVLTRQYLARGYGMNPAGGSNRLFQYYGGVSYPQANRQGIALALLPQTLSLNASLAGIKHLNRLEQVFAHRHFSKPLMRGISYGEALLLDAQQRVTECLHSNLFWIKSGEVFTPRLNYCGVRGVMRDHLLQCVCPELQIAVHEKSAGLAELLEADEVFTCNSVYGLWPVTRLEVKSWSPGKITRKLQQHTDTLGYAEIHC